VFLIINHAVQQEPYYALKKTHVYLKDKIAHFLVHFVQKPTYAGWVHLKRAVPMANITVTLLDYVQQMAQCVFVQETPYFARHKGCVKLLLMSVLAVLFVLKQIFAELVPLVLAVIYFQTRHITVVC
jgi:hypothetical protein